MISASSTAAAGILSSFFGTSSSSSNSTTPSLASVDPSAENSSAAYILDGTLGSNSSLASFLSNATFAGITESLLLDPRANGELTGTPSADVQDIISKIATAEGATAAIQQSANTANTSTDTTDATSPSSNSTTTDLLA